MFPKFVCSTLVSGNLVFWWAVLHMCTKLLLHSHRIHKQAGRIQSRRTCRSGFKCSFYGVSFSGCFYTGYPNEKGHNRFWARSFTERWLGFLGHIVRKRGTEYLCLTGKINECKARGKPMSTFFKQFPRKAADVLHKCNDIHAWKLYSEVRNYWSRIWS